LQVKGGILIGIWGGGTRCNPRANRGAIGAMNIHCNDGELVFKKVSWCSLQQTKAAFVLLGVTTSGEEQ